VIHLGHNRSAKGEVFVAIQEDVQAIAISSYMGGLIEYFKYIVYLLKKYDDGYIKFFGVCGGTVLLIEAKELHQYGVDLIFSPEDGRKMELQGMINRMLEMADFATPFQFKKDLQGVTEGTSLSIARAITFMEQMDEDSVQKQNFREKLHELTHKNTPVRGITGTGGDGKSSLTDELIRRFLNETKDKKVAILSVDPTKRKTGGALL